MPVSVGRLAHMLRAAQFVAVALTALALLAVALLIWLESTWARPVYREPQDAFRHSSIGTELMPLPVAHVLSELFPEHFQPGGEDQGDWVQQFGFLMSDVTENDGQPIGFAISRYRPQSASPSPTDFVGFSCALCHSTRVEAEGEPSRVVYGPGNWSLNLFAWLDAFQAAVLQREEPAEGVADPPTYRLTVDLVAQAYQKKKGRELGIADKAMISLWLRQTRARLEEGLPRFDEPFGHGRSRQPEVVPTGPTRTQPFRTLIRQVLKRPGNDMAVYTKIATVFSQDRRTWAQFDGTVADLDARSSMAAFAAGATVENMRHPEIAHNIRQGSKYTHTLRAPKYSELFPEQAGRLDKALLARGREVYQRHCFSCHGGPSDGAEAWVAGGRHGEVVPLAEIGTDPERVMFRYYGEIPGLLYRTFPPGHPFHFERDQVRPAPEDVENLDKRGYVNAPIDGAFLRAPYLHNASVLTLAELINLRPRRSVFYRGRNYYDPVGAGFRSPDAADARHYFRFDTSLRGNSNKGHDYPWAYADPRRDEADLRALLDYLKTL